MGNRGGTRVTIVTEYFHPEEASTAQLLTSLATGLQGEFDVSVITGYPNYHEEDRNRAVPRRETHEGVSVERVPATRFNKDNYALRVVNWLTFALFAFVRLARTRDQDEVVMVLSNPPLLPLAAWAAKRLRDFPYAYLIHDFYPDVPIGLGMIPEDSLVARVWDRASRLIYRDADRLIVLGDAMKERLVHKMNEDPTFDSSAISVIPNWEDGSVITPRPKSENSFAREHGLVEPFTILYSGNIGRFHELRTTIDAIGRLEDRGRTDVQFVIIGEGARKEEHRRYVEEQSIQHVRFFPFQPADRLPETLTACDASLVGIVPEVSGLCVSSKLYSALAAGRPILAVVGKDDEVARVVRTHDCGAYVPPGEVERAADTLAAWADSPNHTAELGRRARSAFEAHYTRSHAVEAYGRVFNQMHSRA